MDLNAITNSYVPPETSSASSSVGKDDFLKLFTFQLRYQDPMNPLDGTEFTAQLAQFSSLEQLNNINSQLHDMLLYQNSLQNTLATNLIGKEIRVSGDETYLSGTAGIGYDLQADALKVKISIYDAGGKVIREMDNGQQNSGIQSYTWDGKDSSGVSLPEGLYKFKVEAYDASGNPVDVNTMTYGTVTGITYDNNITYLVIDGSIKVQLNEVKEINTGGV